MAKQDMDPFASNYYVVRFSVAIHGPFLGLIHLFFFSMEATGSNFVSCWNFNESLLASRFLFWYDIYFHCFSFQTFLKFVLRGGTIH